MKYTTTFPATENPISENGNWNTNVPASWTTAVDTVGGSPGHAQGENSSASNDSIAMLNGPWGPNHTVTITVNGNPSGAAEVEAHLRMSFDVPGNNVFTYEIDVVPSLTTIFVVRWNGPQGNVTTITQANGVTISDGDIIVASISGPANAVKIVVTQNGATLIDGSTLDTAGYATGNPGMGFDAGTVADGQAFNIRGYTADDGISTSVPPIGRFAAPVLLWKKPQNWWPSRFGGILTRERSLT